MRGRTIPVAMGLLALLGLTPGPATTQELDAAAVDRIRVEVTAAVDRYYQLYSELNPEALADEVFHLPWMAPGGGGMRVDLDRDESVGRFREAMDRLIESGWQRSVFTTEHVCVLNDRAAIATGYNTRYRPDGSVMSVGGVTYLFGRTDDGWKILFYTSLPRERLVRCD